MLKKKIRAENFNVLDETQDGFRKSRSIFIIHGFIKLLLAQGKHFFIDYEKAFDFFWAKWIKMGSSSKRPLKNMY